MHTRVVYCGNPDTPEEMLDLLGSMLLEGQFHDLRPPLRMTLDPAMVVKFGRQLFEDFAAEHEVVFIIGAVV